jgi:hypothetical protein
MDDAEFETPSHSRKLGASKIILIGMAGYLLGSFLPAGFVGYFVRTKLFPESAIGYQEAFDRTKLQGAAKVSWKDLTDAVDINPSLFKQKYEGKPVTLSGKIEHFLDGSLGSTDQTLTLYTGSSYGDTSVIMTFDKPTDPKVVALRKEGPVTATCMVSGSTTDSVHLNHCEVSN